MELLLLAQAALTIVTPFVIKTGEKIAEKIGEEIFNFIKIPFNSEGDKMLIAQVEKEANPNVLEASLLQKMMEDAEFAYNLKGMVEDAQKKIKENAQEINNNAAIEKQINIQNNSGSIQM